MHHLIRSTTHPSSPYQSIIHPWLPCQSPLNGPSTFQPFRLAAAIIRALDGSGPTMLSLLTITLSIQHSTIDPILIRACQSTTQRSTRHTAAAQSQSSYASTAQPPGMLRQPFVHLLAVVRSVAMLAQSPRALGLL